MRSLSLVNRHHARESATGLATPSFPDRGAHFRDKDRISITVIADDLSYTRLGSAWR